MSEGKHTPTPWEAKSLMVVAGRDSITHCGGMLPPARVKESVANAEFIVRAANSHAALLAACVAAEKALVEIADAVNDYLQETSLTEWSYVTDRCGTVEQLRAAISSATPAKT